MDIVAWRETRNDDKTVVCRLQLRYKDGRKVKTLLRELDEWYQCSSGFSPKKKESILIPEHFIPAFKPAKVFVQQVKEQVVPEKK